MYLPYIGLFRLSAIYTGFLPLIQVFLPFITIHYKRVFGLPIFVQAKGKGINCFLYWVSYLITIKRFIMTYKIGITSYDDWNLLWETKVGLDNENMTLLYSVWGNTSEESLDNASNLVRILKENLR